VTLDELLAHLLGRREIAALKPWVGHDVGDGEALVRVEVEHGGDQVLELLVEEAFGFPIGVSRPELLGAVRGDQLVVRVFQVGHVEGWVTRVQHEEDDSEGEQVNDLALVRLLGMDLWGHEAEGSDDAAVHAVACAAFDGAGEAEIDHLHVVEFVEQDVLAFKVTMSEALGVDVVDGLDELFGVVANDALLEGARVRYVIEELAAVDKLADDVGHRDPLTGLLGPGRVFIEFEILDDMLVVERLD